MTRRINIQGMKNNMETTITLNEQQVVFLKEVLLKIIEEDELAGTWDQVMRQIINKLEEN